MAKYQKRRAALANWVIVRKMLAKILKFGLKRMNEISREDFEEINIRNTKIEKKK